MTPLAGAFIERLQPFLFLPLFTNVVEGGVLGSPRAGFRRDAPSEPFAEYAQAAGIYAIAVR